MKNQDLTNLTLKELVNGLSGSRRRALMFEELEDRMEAAGFSTNLFDFIRQPYPPQQKAQAPKDDLSDIFTNEDRWCHWPLPKNRRHRVYPNHGYHTDGIIAVALRRNIRSEDFSCSEGTLQTLIEMRDSGHRTYIVLQEHDGGFIEAFPTSQLERAIGDAPSKKSSYAGMGNYWWLDIDLNLVENGS